MYSAVLAKEQTRCAISEERHKSGAQAKGKQIPRNARSTDIYSFSYRYIKELAERVNRLENSGATPPEVQYAPVNHDPSGAGSVYAPPLDYTRQRNNGMMIGPQIFETGHQELQETTAQGLHGSRVLHPSSLIHHQNRDTLNNMAPDPSID